MPQPKKLFLALVCCVPYLSDKSGNRTTEFQCRSSFGELQRNTDGREWEVLNWKLRRQLLPLCRPAKRSASVGIKSERTGGQIRTLHSYARRDDKRGLAFILVCRW